jgi:hypothetical protein
VEHAAGFGGPDASKTIFRLDTDMSGFFLLG